MPNFYENFDYEEKVLIIDDFDYSSSTDIQGVYTEGEDGGNPIIRERTDTPLSKVGLANGRFPITDSTHSSTWTADGTIGIKDAAPFTGVTSGQPTQGKIKVKLTRSNTSQLTAVTIRWGSSSSDYVTWTPTLPSTTATVNLEANLSALTMTGTVDWNNPDYLQIRATSASSSPTLDLSGLRVSLSNYETQGMWDEGTTYLTNGSSLWFTNRRHNDPSILAPGETSAEIFNYVQTSAGSFTQSGTYTVISKFLWQDQSSGNEVGVAFNVSTSTVGAENGYVAYLDGSDGKVYLDKFTAGSKSLLEAFTTSGFTIDTPYWIKVEVGSSNHIRVSYSVDGIHFTSAIDYVDSSYTSGKVGMYVKGTPVAEFFTFESYADPYVKFGEFSFSYKNLVRLDNVQEMNAPDRDIRILDIADANKSVYVSDYFKDKFINVSGKIYAPSGEGDFQDTVDTLKKYLTKPADTLRVSRPTNTSGNFVEHVYEKAIATNLDAIKSDFYHKQFLPFNIIFQCPNGTAKVPRVFAEEQYAWSSSYFERVHYFKTSASPLPFITITLTDATPAAGDPLDSIVITNTTTGQRITIDSDGVYNDGDIVTIDFENSEVKLNGYSVAYTGLASDNFFAPGKNLVSYNITRTNSIAFQNPAPTSGGFTSGGKQSGFLVAQQFQAPSSTNYPRFDVYMKSSTNSTTSYNNVTLRIETSSGGSPSGTLANAGNTATVLVNNTTFQMVPFVLDTAAALTATTFYWVVLESSHQSFVSVGGSSLPPTGYHYFRGSSTNAFTPASYKEDTNGGSSETWVIVNSNYDMSFIGYFDGPTGISGTLDISYEQRVR